MHRWAKVVAVVGISIAGLCPTAPAQGGLHMTEVVDAGPIPDGSGSFVIGMLGTVRSTADPRQRLSCSVRQYVTPIAVLDILCTYTDFNGGTRSCTSNDTRLRDMIQSINPDSRLGFGISPSGQCMYILVDNSSAYQAKEP